MLDIYKCFNTSQVWLYAFFLGISAWILTELIATTFNLSNILIAAVMGMCFKIYLQNIEILKAIDNNQYPDPAMFGNV